MNRSGVAWRGPALFGLLFSLYLISSLAFLFYAPDESWEGYYTLLVPRAQDDARIPGALAEAGITGVVSARSATVTISNFSGLEKVPLSRIDERLASMDPRLDPYIRSLPALFEAGADRQYRVYYVPSEGGRMALRRKLRSALSEVDGWRLGERRGPRWAVFLGAFALVVALSAAFFRRSRFVVLGGALPWLGLMATGGPGTFVAASLIYFAWVMFADTGRRYLDHRLQYGSWEEGRSELLWSLLVLGGTWALVLGFYPGVSFAALGPILLASLAVAAWTAMSVGIMMRRRTRQDHRLFVPVSMRMRPPALSAASRFAPLAPWVALLVVGAPYLATLLPSAGVDGVPQPVPLSGHDHVDFEALQAVDRASSSGLVDLSDYLAHRAYQEGFVYGAEYGLPAEGEALYLSRFSREGESTVREREVVLRFDREWLEKTLQSAGGNGASVASLLANGNTPAGVVRSPAPGVYSQVTHPARYSLQALLAFSPFLVLSIRVFAASRSGAPIPVLRRKRQAA